MPCGVRVAQATVRGGIILEEKEFKNCIKLLSKNPEKTKELYSLLKTRNELSQKSFIGELEKIQKERRNQ